jgi:predicted site-specific integrase-resolvase
MQLSNKLYFLIMSDQKLLKPSKVCEMLYICRKTLARYEELGYLNPIRISQRKFLYDSEDVQNLIKTNKARKETLSNV